MRLRRSWGSLVRLYGNNPRVAPTAEWADDELGLDEPEVTEESELAPPSSLPGGPLRKAPPRTWKERLASVDVAMQGPVGALTQPWPPGRELLSCSCREDGSGDGPIRTDLALDFLFDDQGKLTGYHTEKWVTRS